MTKLSFRNAHGWKLVVRKNLTFLLLVCVLVPLYGVQITRGLPNRDVVWSFDCNPLIPIIAVKKVFLDGWNTGFYSAYPDFHRWILSILIIPYMEIQYLLGNLNGLKMSGGYPYGLEDFDTIFMHIAIITRGISLVMAVGTMYCCYRVGKTLFPNHPAIFGSIIIGFSPAIVYYVHTETLDLPMLFWFSSALYCYIRVLQTFRLKYYIWLAILAALSTATKDYAYGTFVLLPIPLVWYLAREEYKTVNAITLFQSLVNRRHVTALLVFVASFVAAENVLWNPSGFLKHMVLASGGEENAKVAVNFGQATNISVERIPQITRIMPFVLGWCGFAVCIAGILTVAIRNKTAFLWLLWPIISYYSFTILLVTGPNSNLERPYIPLGFIMALFGGQFLAALWFSTRGSTVSRIACIVIVLAIGLNGAAFDVMLILDTRYQVEKWFADNVAKGASVNIYALRYHSPRLYDCWNQEILNLSEPAGKNETQIDSPSAFEVAPTRPDYLVVANSFTYPFQNVTRYTPKSSIRKAGQLFFDGLDAETSGYTRICTFKPWCGGLFGIPKYRRPIPELTVFRRQETKHGSREIAIIDYDHLRNGTIANRDANP